MVYIYELFSNIYILGIASVVASFVISVKMFPAIICLAEEKNLMADLCSRSSHSQKTPNLGGIGIFIAFTLTIMILASVNTLMRPELSNLLLLLAAITIMFFLGVKDDLIGITPKKKFAGQAIAASLVVFLTDVRILSLEGIFGFGELPYIISVLLTVLVFLFIINAFNLIDGIDGLAGTIAILACSVFGFFFMVYGQYLLMTISFILIGGLLGFLRFNFSKKHKLFMGDSGSLFIGFLLTYLAVSFLELGPVDAFNYTLPNKAVLVIAVLSFPILDTLRVFTIRILQKRSPFTADRNHIHHRLIDLGLTHKQGTLIVALANIGVVGLVFFIGGLNASVQFLIIAGVVPALGLLPFLSTLSAKTSKETPSANSELSEAQ